MMVENAKIEDIGLLTELRLAYLNEVSKYHYMKWYNQYVE